MSDKKTFKKHAVATFTNVDYEELENELNRFLSEIYNDNGDVLIDVKFSTAMNVDTTVYSAMVLYSIEIKED